MWYEKKYPEAITFFKKAFEYGNENVPSVNEYLDLAICYLNIKDSIQALEALKKSVLKGNIEIEKQTWLKNMFSQSHWNILKTSLPQLKNEYWCNLKNKDSYIEIAKLESNDQLVRMNFENRISKEEFNKLLGITDSINHQKLKELVKTKGANPLCFLLYHLYGENKKYFAFYDSIFKIKIFKGEADPSIYVQWFDRQRVDVDGKKTQLYGEYNEMGSKEFYPIEDIANVDKRRKEVGLCTLREYSLKNNLNLPKNYITN
jgi:tetratricopeptide (TPR) repeat protein